MGWSMWQTTIDRSPPVRLRVTRVSDGMLGALAEGIGQGSWLGGGPGAGLLLTPLRPHSQASGLSGEVG